MRVIASELTKGDYVLQLTRFPGAPQLGGLAQALIIKPPPYLAKADDTL